MSVGYPYLVYIVFMIWSVVAFGDRIANNFASVPVSGNWFKAGLTFPINYAKLPPPIVIRDDVLTMVGDWLAKRLR